MSEHKNKLVAVINKNIEVGRAMNALAHMAFGLGGSKYNEKDKHLIDYIDADNTNHPQISEMPFIVLKASGNKIRNLRIFCTENNIPFTDFLNTMIDETWQKQIERTKATKEEDLVYWGIAILGDKEKLNELTKKFSLYK